MDKAKVARQLFRKFLNNECSEEEIEVVRKLLKTGDFKDELDAELQDHWHAITDWEDADVGVDVEAQLETFKVHRADSANGGRSWRPILSVAASVLVLVAFTIYFIYPLGEKPAVYITRTSKRGETVKFQLSDGSVVHLNGESEIRYPERFAKSARETYIRGEVFFEVTKMANRPFFVHTEALTVQVVGTSFDVMAYPEDSVTMVTVNTGKVNVRKSKQVGVQDVSTLVPGQQLQFDHNTQQSHIAEVDALVSSAWIDGKLLFKEASMPAVARALERAYHVRIVYPTNAFAGCKLNASFDNVSLKEVLETLRLTNQVSYKVNGRTIEINGKGCKSTR